MKYFCQQDALKFLRCHLFENNRVFKSFDQTIIATTKFSSYFYFFKGKLKQNLCREKKATLTRRGIFWNNMLINYQSLLIKAT